ncbi:MAG: hypothetical protein ACFB0G_13205, partial [Leptolyngbyaceae cyanobacterium]
RRVVPFLEMSWEPQVGQVISIAIVAIPLDTLNRSYFSLSFTLVDYPKYIHYAIRAKALMLKGFPKESVL